MKRFLIGLACLVAGASLVLAPAAFAVPGPAMPPPTDTPSPSPTAGVPDFELSPASYTFSTQCIGASQSKAFTITNTGDVDIAVDSITSSVTPAFTAATPTPSTIPPGETASFDVRFAPNRGGTISSVITVSANGVQRTANVTGTGRDAELSVAPRSLSFGAQRVGAIAPARSVVIASTGTDRVTVKTISLSGSGDFSKDVSGPVVLQPNTQLRVSIAFSASSLGRKFGSLKVTSDACDATDRSVQLTGIGGEPGVTVQPTTLVLAGFPGTAGTPGSVTISSSGLTPLVVRAVTLTGPEADQFVMSGVPQLPATVQPGDAILIDLRFRPTAEKVPAPTATLVIGSSDAKRPSVRIVITSEFASPSPSPSPTASPTPSPSSSASPKAASTGGPDFGEYAGELLVLLAVAGIFVALVLLRNSKMRRIARRAGV